MPAPLPAKAALSPSSPMWRDPSQTLPPRGALVSTQVKAPTPKGLSAISRRSSEAIPPVCGCLFQPHDPERVAAAGHADRVSLGSRCDPAGVGLGDRSVFRWRRFAQPPANRCQPLRGSNYSMNAWELCKDQCSRGDGGRRSREPAGGRGRGREAAETVPNKTSKPTLPPPRAACNNQVRHQFTPGTRGAEMAIV